MVFTTKFNLEDEVWHMANNSVKESRIWGIKVETIQPNTINIIYSLSSGGYYKESELFESKELLLKSL